MSGEPRYYPTRDECLTPESMHVSFSYDPEGDEDGLASSVFHYEVPCGLMDDVWLAIQTAIEAIPEAECVQKVNTYVTAAEMSWVPQATAVRVETTSYEDVRTSFV